MKLFVFANKKHMRKLILVTAAVTLLTQGLGVAVPLYVFADTNPVSESTDPSGSNDATTPADPEGAPEAEEPEPEPEAAPEAATTPADPEEAPEAEEPEPEPEAAPEAATTPADPAATPATAPADPATAPAPTQADPATAPADPAATSAAPATTSAAPATTPADPATAPADPAATPATTPADPATAPADPAATPRQRRQILRQQTVTLLSADPATAPADPAATPATTQADPATAPADPAATPATTPADPAATLRQRRQILRQQTVTLSSADPASEDTAETPETSDSSDKIKVTYDYNATLYDPTETAEGERPGGDYPGVYKTGPLQVNSATAATAPTIGLPSIADANLDKPTTEAPAIIQGAAVGYEEKTGAVEYTTIKERVEPYTDFKYNIMEETAADGTVHQKLTGFDKTYVIARLDVSQFFEGDNSNKYLHMNQEQNMALIPGAGMVDSNGSRGFIEQLTGNMTGSYLISDLKDKVKGAVTPYIDILMFATAKNAAGADAGKTGVANGDIPIQFYVDDVADYNPSLTYDPMSTDPNHTKNVLAKFFDAAKVAASSISHYLIKGSDLALEVEVENSGGENKDKGTTYWSLKKAFENPYYDQEADKSPDDEGCGRTLKLISEVAVTDGLTLKGTDANNLRKRTLDVNTFDVQVASNTTTDKSTYSDGFDLENAWLTIKDSSHTTGAEMAIGNNARFIIGQGAKLFIDETCQLEVEWDGATTTTPGKTSDILNNGFLDLREGGEIVNNGIITIEGFEGKPHQAGQQVDDYKGCGELTIEKGATLTNNGCIMIYGKMYNLGTLVNNGRYDDIILSNDPDKGAFAYHRGIVISWKDDVTQPNVYPGELYNGQDSDGVIYAEALLLNNGDILLAPGTINNYGKIKNSNGANIYLADATEAIIPIEPTPEAPLVVSKRITLDKPVGSYINNYGVIENAGGIRMASVPINDNASLGSLTVLNGEYSGPSAVNYYGSIINIVNSKSEHSSSTSLEEITKLCAGNGQKIIVPFPGGIMITGGTTANKCFRLFLYDDGSFRLILDDGTVISGSYRFVNNTIVFTLPDGSEVGPDMEKNGDLLYSYTTRDGKDVSFALKADTVEMISGAYVK